ncbi:hypothetical protein [Paenibacillus sedimenti]|uniref:Uncharacterized protein n=1 Tax=Paenibacillus sedimenti TaxID=2770274 RepID=A0A926QHV3_9BACL|nr:hypothetical protein [Paenibacillus sedimenti]MBD0379885.1 hypothetical protein [Paenibacillus sedimenti]
MGRKVIFIIFLIIICTSLVVNIRFYYNIHNFKGSAMQMNNSLEQSVKQLSDKLSNTNLIIENLKSESENLKNNNAEIIGKLHALETDSAMRLEDETNIKKIYKIIDSLPEVSKKLAFIKELRNEKGIYYLVLDYVNWFSGDDAKKAAKEDNNPNAASLSNNFYIRNERVENDKVVLGNDAMIYELNGAMLKYIEFNEFTSEKSNTTNRLFNILFVSDKLILLEEQYRP